MEKELIYIGSVNKAIKAREILRENGIFSRIEREMDNDKKTGCGYSVLIVDGLKKDAEAVLYRHGFIKD